MYCESTCKGYAGNISKVIVVISWKCLGYKIEGDRELRGGNGFGIVQCLHFGRETQILAEPLLWTAHAMSEFGKPKTSTSV